MRLLKFCLLFIYITYTVKFRKLAPGLYFSKALFEGLIINPSKRGLYSEGLIYGGKFAFKIDWASLIVESEITVFALFYFVFEVNFPSTSPRGAYIWRGDLAEGFLLYRFGGAYIWSGLYMEGLIFGILRYFGIDIVSRRLLKWISRIENGLKLRPTTRFRTHSNQISTRLIQIMKVTKKVTLK